MTAIQVLPDHLINQIKAGEVIDRPSSVVKELVENGLDACANFIRVELVDGGKQLIRVTDNGTGMSKEDLKNCCLRHATSKISRLEDLDQISTMGFRGEALPSMGAVAHLSLSSRTLQDKQAYRICVDNGLISEIEACAQAQGTVVTVRDLFSLTPARLKFLKATATEYAHILDLIEGFCYAYPMVEFVLVHNGKVTVNCPAHKNHRERFDFMMRLDAEKYQFIETQSHGVQIFGFAIKPENAKPNSALFLTYINGRMVRDKFLRGAVHQGYEGLIIKGQSPSILLFVSLNSSEVDVNVSPSKTEVRFRDGLLVQDLIVTSIKNSLKSSSQETFNTFLSSHPTHLNATEVENTKLSQVVKPIPTFSPSRLQGLSKNFPTEKPAYLSEKTSSLPQQIRVEEPVSPPLPERLIEDSIPVAHARYLGQYQKCYLLFEWNHDLWIVDQHAFHERILFEEYVGRESEKSHVEKIQLIVPLFIEVSKKLFIILQEEAEGILRQLGFEVEFVDEKIALHAHPASMTARQAQDTFQELIERCEVMFDDSCSHEPNKAAGLAREQIFHMSAATLACHSAVRAGQELTTEHVNRLIRRSHDVDFCAHCPHGRPVFRAFKPEDVAAWFLRS